MDARDFVFVYSPVRVHILLLLSLYFVYVINRF